MKPATDLVFNDPCVLFALRRESQAFRREFRPHQRFGGAPCWARFCGPSWLTVLVVETGVGTERTRQALQWLLHQPRLGQVPYRPRVLLSAGFAGALHPDLHVGDIVLAREVVDAAGQRWPTTWPDQLPPGPWQPPLHQGPLLTSPRLVATGAEKRTLHQRHQALAVDMESAMVAQMCHRLQIPFACVRAISDDAQTSLSPRLVSLLAGGRVSPWRLLGNVLRSPTLLPDLWRLGRQTKMAAENLGKALGELLTLTLPWLT